MPRLELGTLREHIDQKSVSLRAIYHAYHANDILAKSGADLATFQVLGLRSRSAWHFLPLEAARMA